MKIRGGELTWFFNFGTFFFFLISNNFISLRKYKKKISLFVSNEWKDE